MFSNPHAPGIREPNFEVPSIIMPMAEDWSRIQDNEILLAIDQLKANSAPGPDGVPATLIKKCAASLVYPVKYLMQKSIDEGSVPNYYKSSYVCPLYKKGDRSRAENYRPVSKTSHIIKTQERVIRQKMVDYLESNSLLSINQHGFRSNRSTMTQLLHHFDAIYEGLLGNVDTDSIYLDYEKAFDKVDHRLLLHKLVRYKFPQMLIDWISSFLKDRDQIVVVSGSHSDPHRVVSGVPQGTVLGPVLFLIFINDIENYISGSNIGFFADDTRIACQINSSTDVQLLQDALNAAIDWSGKK